MHLILEHIKEVDARKLYLERAYSSMYEYLVKELGYSGSAAMRRLEAARLLREVPVISERIQEGSLNLSQIGELSKVIKEKERKSGEKVSCVKKSELVSMIVGKTTFETQKELSLALDVQIKEHEMQRMQKNESVRVEMTFSKEQYEKLLRCKDLSAHLVHQNNLDSSWASLIEVLADQYMKNERKVAGKISRDSNQNSSESLVDATSGVESVTTCLSENKSGSIDDVVPNFKDKKGDIKCSNIEEGMVANGIDTVSVSRRINKSITAKTRREIIARDLCCQFRDPLSGKQCKSTYGLQIDHKNPRWNGGDNSFSNLTALCMHHNQQKYRKEANIRFI